MRSHLSIFNSETLVEFPKPTFAFLFCILLLGLARLSFWGMQQVFERVDWVNNNDEIMCLKAYAQKNHTEKPKVVFIGSSRFKSGIAPDVWANQAGMPPQSVVNLAIDSGCPWDQLVILRSAPALLQGVKLAFVETEPWMYNLNSRNPINHSNAAFPDHFIRWASLRERLIAEQPAQSAKYLFNALWPVYERRTLDGWCHFLFRGFLKPLPVKPTLPGPPEYHTDMKLKEMLAENRAFDSFNIVKNHFYDPFSPPRWPISWRN